MHRAGLVHRISECRLAQRSSELREQERGRGLVIPHVRAVPEAASALIVDSLKAVELAVRGSETGGRGKRREIRRRGVFDGGRYRALPNRDREAECARFKAMEIVGGV